MRFEPKINLAQKLPFAEVLKLAEALRVVHSYPNVDHDKYVVWYVHPETKQNWYFVTH